jgi:hypothetical protein
MIRRTVCCGRILAHIIQLRKQALGHIFLSVSFATECPMSSPRRDIAGAACTTAEATRRNSVKKANIVSQGVDARELKGMERATLRAISYNFSVEQTVGLLS